MDAFGLLAAFGRAALDLVAPARCAGCGSRKPLRRGLCVACHAEIHATVAVAAASAAWPSGPVPTFAGASYEGSVRACLLAYKERGRHEVRQVLVDLLFRAAMRARAVGCLPAVVVLVPVPSRRSATWARGHDVTWLLTKCVARRLRANGVRARAKRALTHVRQVADQSGLSAGQRKANLAGALRARRRLRDGTAGVASAAVVIVDDIVTTGATSAEAARALAAAGARPIGVLAVAATPRRSLMTRESRVGPNGRCTRRSGSLG